LAIYRSSQLPGIAEHSPGGSRTFDKFQSKGPMLKDFLFAVRLLAKSPGFVVVAACSLAIGIGANSAIYSLANVLLLRPLPVLDPSRVVNVHAITNGPFGGNTRLSHTPTTLICAIVIAPSTAWLPPATPTLASSPTATLNRA
jgi:hypothetical protein